MNRTTLITAAATGALCLAALLLQANRNRALAEQVETEDGTVTQLERQAASPGAAPGPVSALNPDAPLPGSIDAAVAEERANTTPQERIDRAVSRIELMVADIGDLDRSPAELFRLLPDLLRLVQDLDLDEMIAVADKIDAPLNMNSNSGKSAMKMILTMLAAEQDPERILRIPEVMETRQLRMTVLNALARRDPEAARRWMENSDLSDGERKQFKQMLTLRLLREDFNAGLERLRGGDNDMRQALAMAGQFAVSEDSLPDVIAAMDRPENAELRPNLVDMVLGASIAQGGVARARERVDEMGLSNEDVNAYLGKKSYMAAQGETGALLDWMSEVQTPEQLATSLPSTIRILLNSWPDISMWSGVSYGS